MRSQYYDRQGQPLYDDIMAWGRLRDDDTNVHVRQDVIGDAEVVTVWHGMNVRLGADPPHLFETLIFGGRYDLERMTYATEAEAIDGHATAVVDLTVGRRPFRSTLSDERE